MGELARFENGDPQNGVVLSVEAHGREVCLFLHVTRNGTTESFDVDMTPIDFVQMDFRQESPEHRSWYQFNHETIWCAPPLCPPHLPVFGVAEEPETNGQR